MCLMNLVFSYISLMKFETQMQTLILYFMSLYHNHPKILSKNIIIIMKLFGKKKKNRANPYIFLFIKKICYGVLAIAQQ